MRPPRRCSGQPGPQDQQQQPVALDIPRPAALQQGRPRHSRWHRQATRALRHDPRDPRQPALLRRRGLALRGLL
eukprot:3476647-Pyramimonas_sp.AAC.1